MGTKNARKCNNDVRTYTPRSSTTGRRDTKANRARRQDRFKPVTPAWLRKRISAEIRDQNGFYFIIFQSRKPGKGEVGGSSLPRPTIKIRSFDALTALR